MIYIYISLGVLAVLVFAEFWTMYLWKEFLRGEIQQKEDLIIKSAEFTAELSDRIDSVEDYVKIIRSETENDKHADYWASVMNYNPFIEKEGEK